MFLSEKISLILEIGGGKTEFQQSADVVRCEPCSVWQSLVLDKPCSDSFHCFGCRYTCEEGGDVKGDHCFIQSQLKMFDFVSEIRGVVDVVRGVSHQWCQDGGKVFCDVVSCRVDAADNRSEWDILFVYFWESIYAWSAISRIQAVIGWSVQSIFLLQFLKTINYLLLVAGSGVSLQCFIGVVVTEELTHFLVVVRCIEDHSASPFVRWKNGDVLILAEGCDCLSFLEGKVGWWWCGTG